MYFLLSGSAVVVKESYTALIQSAYPHRGVVRIISPGHGVEDVGMDEVRLFTPHRILDAHGTRVLYNLLEGHTKHSFFETWVADGNVFIRGTDVRINGYAADTAWVAAVDGSTMTQRALSGRVQSLRDADKDTAAIALVGLRDRTASIESHHRLVIEMSRAVERREADVTRREREVAVREAALAARTSPDLVKKVYAV
jgi:hypothetical protein